MPLFGKITYSFQLWSHVAKSAHTVVEMHLLVLLRLDDQAESEIKYFEGFAITVSLQSQVGKLDIGMDDSLAVNIGNSLQGFLGILPKLIVVFNWLTALKEKWMRFFSNL